MPNEVISPVSFSIALAHVIGQTANLVANGAKFASVTYTSKETGEVARHTLLLGCKYGNLLKASRKVIARKRPANEMGKKAKENVLASLDKSIEANANGTVSDAYTCKGVYESIEGTAGAVKAHVEDGVFHLQGVTVSKVVLVPGVHKPDTRRPLTKAQDDLKKGLPISKFRQFRLSPENMMNVRMGGRDIIFA